jgi:hypothetical protein
MKRKILKGERFPFCCKHFHPVRIHKNCHLQLHGEKFHQSLFRGIAGRSVRRPGKRDDGVVRTETGSVKLQVTTKRISVEQNLTSPELRGLLTDSHHNNILLVVIA